MRRARAARPAIAAALVAALAGCGLGPGPGTTDANLTVTRDFGGASVGQVTQKRVPGAETVMQMLQRSFKIDTRYGGGFVHSIDSVTPSSARTDWFYYVNGIEAQQGAATTAVHRGDRVWWDLHDWRATNSVPAVVGSFPEPFVHGTGGKRLPTVLECAPDVQAACHRVSAAMKAAGVPVAGGQLGGGSGSESLALLVGTWHDLHGVLAAELVDAGPPKSGVYARFVGAGGQALELLDPRGRVVQTLHRDAGLVAATEQVSLNQPTWLITGTDTAGVEAAASALSASRLHNHFALAIAGSRDLPLPLLPGR